MFVLQDDLRVIDALEWLIFNVEQRPEALRQANAIMRIFLGLYNNFCQGSFIAFDRLSFSLRFVFQSGSHQRVIP